MQYCGITLAHYIKETGIKDRDREGDRDGDRDRETVERVGKSE